MGNTSGIFVPAALPECPYSPRMTRAAAQALAAGGGLRENCVVVITDGPVIGTTGNTSPTEIELNPVSSTALGQTARVFTTFSPDAWPGVYDITNHAITELRDDFGNTVKDVDATAPTVHTQFPWHLGSATMRDNYVEDSTLIGWDTQVGSVSNNRVINSTVDLTGKTAGVVIDNLFQGAGVIFGAGGGSANISRSAFYAPSPVTPLITHSGTGAITFTDAIVRDGFIVSHTGTGALTVSNSTLENHLTAAIDLNHATTGTGGTSVLDSRVQGAVGNPAIDNQAAAGLLSVAGDSDLSTSRLIRAAGTVGALSVGESRLRGTVVTVGAANGATTNTFQNVDVSGSVFSLLGPVAAPGRNDFTTGARLSGLSLTVAANATAGVQIQGGRVNGTINQNQTAGTASLAFFEPDIRGFSTITNNQATDPTQSIGLNRIFMTDSVLNISGIGVKTAPGSVLQQADLTGSTLNLTGLAGAALINRLRMFGATLTNAGFDGGDLIIDGAFTKTMGATQNNRLANKSYDDWV